ncbi:MAG: AroB-related putative sugar phosphate phospholyase (cyclizing) [Rhodospirillales bacterium]
MPNVLEIQSHKGPYTVTFGDCQARAANHEALAKTHVIVDRRIAELHADKLKAYLSLPSVLILEAIEENKSLDKMPAYVDHLVKHSIRRDHVLLAIGGGIIQDITCFLAATLLRGVPWHFFPTTLLAQADSCIGSKSSINSGGAKNILGTFTPPQRVTIDKDFLNSLDDREIRSGLGEIIKVHAIDGPKSFDALSHDYDDTLSDPNTLARYIFRALEIKKHYIEIDEFDRGVRNIFNYGHSFGHAIEAATNFSIPHGIAVTIGMDMANYTATKLGVSAASHFDRMHPMLRKNFSGYETHPVPVGPFIAAISKDKKNVGAASVTLILPDTDGKIFKDSYSNDDVFASICKTYLEENRSQ